MVKEMTKQDRIREGIAKDLAVIATRGRPKYAYYTREDTWQAVLAEGIDGDFLEDARLIIVGLNAEGCVLKVDRELPENPHKGKFDKVNQSYPNGIPKGYHILRDAGAEEGYDEAQEDMTGYVVVEPIIKEE